MARWQELEAPDPGEKEPAPGTRFSLAFLPEPGGAAGWICSLHAGKKLMKSSLSLAEARRLALAAQGFTFPKREGKANWMKINNTIKQINLLQIDSVNVLVRSHYLPVYSRLGHYDHATLDARSFSNRKRTMFECWSQGQALCPSTCIPLRWRMNRPEWQWHLRFDESLRP
jgi:uncharacterized protein YcaQ